MGQVAAGMDGREIPVVTLVYRVVRTEPDPADVFRRNPGNDLERSS